MEEDVEAEERKARPYDLSRNDPRDAEKRPGAGFHDRRTRDEDKVGARRHEGEEMDDEDGAEEGEHGEGLEPIGAKLFFRVPTDGA